MSISHNSFQHDIHSRKSKTKKNAKAKKQEKILLQSVLRHAELMQIVSDAYWLGGKTLQEATFTCLDQQLPYQFPELWMGRIGAALSWLLATNYSRQPYGKSFQMLLKKERYIQSWFSFHGCLPTQNFYWHVVIWKFAKLFFPLTLVECIHSLCKKSMSFLFGEFSLESF